MHSMVVRETTDIPQYEPLDVLIAPTDAIRSDDPFGIALEATFYGPGGAMVTVPGFFDERLGYVVRFSPTEVGPWRLRTCSTEPTLDALEGRITCVPNENPHIRGPLSIDAEHPRHMLWSDGEHVFVLGYEANWLLLVDQQPSNLGRIDTFLDSISAHGFNMVTVNLYAHTCRGWLTAEQEDDDRYIKPALAPWVGGNDAPDYRRFDSAFFAHADRVMDDLRARGILAHIMIHVYNKQVNWPELGSSEDDLYWRYVLARYQAFPNVIWDVAKESYYQPPEYIWRRVGTIRQLDGYGRLVTVHDANTPYNPEREHSMRWHHPDKELSDVLGDFKADQVHTHWYEDAARNYAAWPRPYMNIEYGYEQGVEDLPTYRVKQDWREVLRRTWRVVMGGAYPNYYYSNMAWNLFVPLPEPPGYRPHGILKRFWEDTHFWTLAPNPAPLGDSDAGDGIQDGVFCRCAIGAEYVVWDEQGEGFTLLIDGDKLLSGAWLNPLSGETVAIEPVRPGEHRFTPPWGAGAWAVLHLTSRT